jgi:pSer/pThr/pTyr-binding forkhead associated (FHA) protein
MNAQLVVATGSRAGLVIPLTGDRFVIGRADDCNLKPKSELISRYHCEISLAEGGVFVRDMGSKNGVFVNDEKISEAHVLTNGDKLAFGHLEFFIQVGTEAKLQEAPPTETKPIETKPTEVKPAETKPQKPPRVKSVSDAVARTVALQSENTQKSTEDTITDWIFAAGDSDDGSETQIIDPSELIAHLHTQSQDITLRDKEESSSRMGSGANHGAPASSREAAEEVLRKFFKGGK